MQQMVSDDYICNGLVGQEIMRTIWKMLKNFMIRIAMLMQAQVTWIWLSAWTKGGLFDLPTAFI